MSKRRKKSHHQGRTPRPFEKGNPVQEGTFDPLLELMGEGMMPLPPLTTDQNDALTAAVDVIGRTGAMDIEIGYDDDHAEPNWWYATCRIRTPASPTGWAPSTVTKQSSPVVAVEKLARRLINGGTCTHCGRVMSLAHDAGVAVNAGAVMATCFWERAGKRWERGCRDFIEEGVRQEAVIEAFLKAGGRHG